ncbi:hypothetical protein VPNG_01688 [Cytospora leucostoma]|uniref:RING-type domain-containing protein n=1 Tax=Cytospora leucostoma TaxID=1230097 RepID=A0A423XJT6_9PEZI|nr:hypothetical protein VPNG_01688 [Cytospora leucostoma]
MAGPYQQQQLCRGVEDSLLTVVPEPNFLPYPRITLLVDPGVLGQCGICHDSQLMLRSQGVMIDDQTVALLPCGHIAGFVCLRYWFETNKTCPFCRVPLKYELCSHWSKLIRPLHTETLYSIPDPIPVGGKIHLQCESCSVATNTKAIQQILEGLAELFRKLRAEYQAAKHEKLKLIIKRRIAEVKAKIDNAMQELATSSDMARSGW